MVWYSFLCALDDIKFIFVGTSLRLKKATDGCPQEFWVIAQKLAQQDRETYISWISDDAAAIIFLKKLEMALQHIFEVILLEVPKFSAKFKAG